MVRRKMGLRRHVGWWSAPPAVPACGSHRALANETEEWVAENHEPPPFAPVLLLLSARVSMAGELAAGSSGGNGGGPEPGSAT